MHLEEVRQLETGQLSTDVRWHELAALLNITVISLIASTGVIKVCAVQSCPCKERGSVKR